MKTKLNKKPKNLKIGSKADHNEVKVKKHKLLLNQQNLRFENAQHNYVVDWQISNKSVQKKSYIKVE